MAKGTVKNEDSIEALLNCEILGESTANRVAVGLRSSNNEMFGFYINKDRIQDTHFIKIRVEENDSRSYKAHVPVRCIIDTEKVFDLIVNKDSVKL